MEAISLQNMLFNLKYSWMSLQIFTIQLNIQSGPQLCNIWAARMDEPKGKGWLKEYRYEEEDEEKEEEEQRKYAADSSTESWSEGKTRNRRRGG